MTVSGKATNLSDYVALPRGVLACVLGIAAW